MKKNLNNLIELGNFKELREIRKTEESYGRYLRSLTNSQLEPEVNFLLEEFSRDNYGKDFSSKVKMIFDEISLRADVPLQNKISQLSEETLKHL